MVTAAPEALGRAARAAAVKRRSLSRKYIAYFVGLVAFVLTASGAVDAWITYRDAKHLLLRAQAERADSAAQRVGQFMAAIERQLSWASRASVTSPEQRLEDYRRILAETPAILSLAQIDRNGKEIATLSRDGGTTGGGEDWTLTAAAREARQDVAWFGPVAFSRDGPRMQVAMAHSGPGGGFTVAEVGLAVLPGLLAGAAPPLNGYVYLVDGAGKLIASTDARLAARGVETLPQVRAVVLRRPPLEDGEDVDGRSVLSSVASAPQQGWYVFVEQPAATAVAPVASLLLRLLWLFVLGLLICVGAAIVLARRMTAPLHAVQEGAARLASGDFGQAIDVRTGDEIEMLADEFNRMAAQLREFYARLEQKVEDRTHDLARSVSELKTLEEIGRALAASLDLSLVLKTALTRAVELAEADGGAIYTFDRSRRAFHLAEAYGLDPSFVAALREVQLTQLDGLLGEVAEHGRTVEVREIADCPGFPLRAATLAAGFRSALVVPLIAPDGALGALVVESLRPRVFAANKVSLMQAFAHQAVLAMRNARLFRAVEENGRELAIASEHKSRFFANMSHELRTPLNAILGYAELLRDGLYGELPERARQTLERIESNGAHLLGLINDVLDLSKLEAGELALSLDDYSLRAVVEQAVGATFSLAKAKGLRLDQEVEEPLPLGRGDDRRLTQVLINVLSNAIKFTDEGSVSIRARAVGDLFEIVVADTGPGIAPEDQARIFEAFQQGDNTSTRLKGGTGLGLSISKRFVDMHGGSICVASRLGEGARFTILIPIRVERQKAAA